MNSWVRSTQSQCLTSMHFYGRRNVVRLAAQTGRIAPGDLRMMDVVKTSGINPKRWRSSALLPSGNDWSLYQSHKMRNHDLFHLDSPTKRQNASLAHITPPTTSNTGGQVSHRAPQFTDAEIDQLITLRKNGLTLAAISTTMKRSVSAIAFKIYRDAKISHLFAPDHARTHLTADQIDHISALRLKGLSWKSIQRDHFPGQNIRSLSNTYQNSLRTEMGHADFFTKRKDYTAAEDAEICSLREEARLEWREIAYRLRRSFSAVESRYRKLRSPADVVNINRYQDYQPSKQQIADIVRLRDKKGLSFSAISTAIGGEYSKWYIQTLYSKVKKSQTMTATDQAAEEGPDRYLPWTTEEDTKIKHLEEQGMSLTEMESHVPGRTEQSIKFRLQLLMRVGDDLHTHRWYSPEEDKRIIQMHEEGKTWRAIAEACKRPVVGVRLRYSRLAGPNAVKGKAGRPKSSA
ncbi:Hypothetical protein R9X50_00653200 [Acrodontium crateriforme]|uniref:Myb-like domain-containing protein n=1 Tax=Acrodontium crateriforme TaxID=150365 RepID=A0AAQ3M8H8_9PEZI|nr:Hypothetical protein R9X50_00653200 [Acrodontium crateriforme]